MLCETSGYPRMTVLMGKVKWSILFSGKPILWLLWATKCNKPRIDFPTKRGGPANSLMPKLVSNKNIKQGILFSAICENAQKVVLLEPTKMMMQKNVVRWCLLQLLQRFVKSLTLKEKPRASSKTEAHLGVKSLGGPNDWMVIPPFGKPTSREFIWL